MSQPPVIVKTLRLKAVRARTTEVVLCMPPVYTRNDFVVSVSRKPKVSED
ncbi:MAG: hypothetical protein ABH950_03250 [Candidatus Altiarchaeota archaeon]